MTTQQAQESSFLHGQLVQSVSDIQRRLTVIEGRLTSIEERLTHPNGHQLRTLAGVFGASNLTAVGTVIALLKALGLI